MKLYPTLSGNIAKLIPKPILQLSRQFFNDFHNFCFVTLQKADLAVGDITITYEREQAVDFTMPWMNLGNDQLDLWITRI